MRSEDVFPRICISAAPRWFELIVSDRPHTAVQRRRDFAAPFVFPGCGGRAARSSLHATGHGSTGAEG